MTEFRARKVKGEIFVIILQSQKYKYFKELPL